LEGVHFAVGFFGGVLVVLFARLLPVLARDPELARDAVGDGFERPDEVALGGLGVEVDFGYAIYFGLVVIAGGIELGSEVVDQVGVGDVFEGSQLTVAGTPSNG
jgi:hypothetical protein